MATTPQPAQPPASTTAPWQSGQVSPNAYCVLAPNPGPMTLDGTNTWIVMAPDGDEAIVVDGPLDEAHLAGCCASSPSAWAGHRDDPHPATSTWQAGPRFGELTGSRVRAVGRGRRPRRRRRGGGADRQG